MISIIIPVLNESETIASVIQFALSAPNVSEVIVVDDGSIDGTPELATALGARVMTSTLLGKGASMEDGVRAAKNDILLFLDGDLSNLDENLVESMTVPLIEKKVDFVKARFKREAGRVTLLTARPLIATFFPELAEIEQPLGGIIAAHRDTLRHLRFETDYGVDVGLLLDVHASGARLVEVDIGHLEHDSQSLEALGDMAKQVVRVILDRAYKYGRLDIQQVREVEEIERHAQSELSLVLGKLRKPKKVALIDMDGTLLDGRFIVELAKFTQKNELLSSFLDQSSLDPEERTHSIARLFSGLEKAVFQDTARKMPLMPGAVDLVVALRKYGYRVGIVSDSFLVATEIIRKRVFADFSIAHLIKFRHNIATGEVTLSPAMRHESGCRVHPLCKLNVLLHVCHHLNLTHKDVLAIGDNDPDACMLKAAERSIAFQPKSKLVSTAASHVVMGNLLEILSYLPDQEENR